MGENPDVDTSPTSESDSPPSDTSFAEALGWWFGFRRQPGSCRRSFGESWAGCGGA